MYGTVSLKTWVNLMLAFSLELSIKSQALVDFVTELTLPLEALQGNREQCDVWELMVDDLSNQRGVGIGMVLKSPHREIFEQSLKLSFKMSNNEAEYEALINGLKMSLAI